MFCTSSRASAPVSAMGGVSRAGGECSTEGLQMCLSEQADLIKHTAAMPGFIVGAALHRLHKASVGLHEGSGSEPLRRHCSERAQDE